MFRERHREHQCNVRIHPPFRVARIVCSGNGRVETRRVSLAVARPSILDSRGRRPPAALRPAYGRQPGSCQGSVPSFSTCGLYAPGTSRGPSPTWWWRAAYPPRLPSPAFLAMTRPLVDTEAIGRHGRALLVGYPGGRYPVQRFALEEWEGEIFLTADGAVLERFSVEDQWSATAAFHAVYPGLLIQELRQRERYTEMLDRSRSVNRAHPRRPAVARL